MSKQKVSPKKVNRFNLFLERFWLVVGLVMLLLSVIFAFQEGWSKSGKYFLITGLAIGMFFVRRGVRKRTEKNLIANSARKKIMDKSKRKVK